MRGGGEERRRGRGEAKNVRGFSNLRVSLAKQINLLAFFSNSPLALPSLRHDRERKERGQTAISRCSSRIYRFFHTSPVPSLTAFSPVNGTQKCLIDAQQTSLIERRKREFDVRGELEKLISCQALRSVKTSPGDSQTTAECKRANPFCTAGFTPSKIKVYGSVHRRETKERKRGRRVRVYLKRSEIDSPLCV